MPITAPPTIPQITDPSTFATRAQDWVVWQANQLYPALIEESLLLGLSLSGTSVTSNSIGTGSKSFTTQTGLGFKAGQSLSIARTSAPTNRMFVVVDSYDSVTGALAVTSQAFEGSGTFTDWSIALAFNGVISASQLSDDVSERLVPAGAVEFFAMNSAPTGWLKANGALVSRTTYANLFSAIGTIFGVGDGSTTFALPDLRGEFIRGWDDGKGTDSGRVFGSGQLDSFQGHRHTLTDSGGTAVTIQVTASAGSGSTGKYTVAGTPNDLARAEVTNGTNGTPRTSSETRPRNVALLACIKY